MQSAFLWGEPKEKVSFLAKGKGGQHAKAWQCGMEGSSPTGKKCSQSNQMRSWRGEQSQSPPHPHPIPPHVPSPRPHLNPNLKPSCRVELVKQGKVRQSVVFLGPSHYKGLCHLFLNLSIQPCLKPYQNRSPTKNLSTSWIELTRVGDMGI